MTTCLGRLARWGTLAVLGVALVAALTVAALQLTDQHVGLSGEPVGVGAGLAPAVTTRTTPATSAQTTATAPATPTSAPTTGGTGAPDESDGEDD